jgi:hypothetical protein
MMMPPERLRHGGRRVVKESHAATLSPHTPRRNGFFMNRRGFPQHLRKAAPIMARPA